MKPTAFQARVLRDLSEDHASLMSYGNHYRLWCKARLGKRTVRPFMVKQTSAKTMMDAGWLADVPDSRYPSQSLGLTEAGKALLSSLPPEAFLVRPAAKPAVDARGILALLHRRHPSPAFFIGDEFSVGHTIADAVAFRLYRPYECIAYEIKVSRSDFKREMADQRKNKDLLAMVDEFFYVCPAGVIGKDEVPPPVGLIYAWPERLRQVKDFDHSFRNYTLAPLVSRRLTAALLRRSGRLDRQSVRTAYYLATVVERIQVKEPDVVPRVTDGEWVGGLVRDAHRIKDAAVRAGIIGDDLRT